MLTLKQHIGIPLLVSRYLDPAIVELRKREILACFDDLRRALGLEPSYFGVAAIHLHPQTEMHAVGEIDDWHVYLSADMHPGPGVIFPGMAKINGGTVQGVLRHELGHAIEGRFRAAAPEFDAARSMAARDPRLYVSTYAGFLPATARDYPQTFDARAPEYFAESFSAYAHPDFPRSGVRIEPTLLAALERVYPRRA